VAISTTKAKELMAEIAVASQEQAQGVDQINQAVIEMDKVIQRNAATAEESASASEELNGQSAQMKSMVDNLVSLVGGKREEPKKIGGALTVRGKSTPAPSGVKSRAGGKAPTSTPKDVAKAKVVTPEQVIPLDDEDFKNF
jgi:methyl-accepting chemotaxis protein